MMIQGRSCLIFRILYQIRARQLAAQSIRWSSSLGIMMLADKRSPIACQPHVVNPPGIMRYEQQRWFWGIDVAFNKVDEERVRLAGPDRAAAEWVLRNGGAIKWTTSSNQLKDYNLLPSTDFAHYKLEEIDLTATDVIGLGFQHLKDLKHLKKIRLHGCRTIMDDALDNLHFVKDTLQHLEISRCPMITQKGLMELTELKNLKYLILYDLIETKNFPAVVEKLQKAMPWCKIDTTDPLLVEASAEKH